MSVSKGARPEGATSIFVFGLLGLLLCQILGIVAWVQGNSYMNRCREMGVEPEGIATAGRILGIIATVILGIGLAFAVLTIVAGSS